MHCIKKYFQYALTLLLVSITISKRNQASIASEVVRNIREVRSFGTEARELDRFSTQVSVTKSAANSVGQAAGRLEALNRAAIYMSILSGKNCLYALNYCYM
jgi:hypothetical protein